MEQKEGKKDGSFLTNMVISDVNPHSIVKKLVKYLIAKV